MHDLEIARLVCSYDDYKFQCFWFPGLNLQPGERRELLARVEATNARCKRPLRYGLFNKMNGPSWKEKFLERTIWCLIEDPSGTCGFAYHYYLGEAGGRYAIHAGLVEFSKRLGRDMVIMATVPLVAGNLINFGSYVCTNITHVPLIASFFWNSCDAVYPDQTQSCFAAPLAYRSILGQLVDDYIVPVLGCHADDVCAATYRILGSLECIDSDFATRTDALPKSNSSVHNDFMVSWLRTRTDERGRKHVRDDLIQIGVLTQSFFEREPAATAFKKLRFDPSISSPQGEVAALRVGNRARIIRSGD